MLILSAFFFLLLLFDCDKKYNERKQTKNIGNISLLIF